MSKRSIDRMLRCMLLLACMALAPASGYAQLNMTTGNTLSSQAWNADSLVRKVLVGQGVEVSNVQFNGGSSINCNGVGIFSTGSAPTNLGLSSGIVLSASSLPYLNSLTGGSVISTCNNAADANLASIVSNSTIYNCVVLEFDFVPQLDSARFRYVFASEEYYGYECTQFNDVFAFFISGENPAGGNYTNYNIALVPGTTTPITISTINGGTAYGTHTPCILTNTQYFVDNQAFIDLKHLDGFTKVLTAEVKVVPCKTYHLKMAIANVSDMSRPSAVFLEANSFSSNAITFDLINTGNPDSPTDLYEGCTATIRLSRDHVSSTDVEINMSFEGEATNGVDFEWWDTTLHFPDTAVEVVKSLTPYQDGLAEGNGTGKELCKIVLNAENSCPRSDSIEVNIIDAGSIDVQIVHDTLTAWCAVAQLHANTSGGMPEKQIVWTNLTTGATLQGVDISVAAEPDTYWVCEAWDSCGNYGVDTLLVGVRHDFASLPTDTTVCKDVTVRFCAHYAGNYDDLKGLDSCVWYANGQLIEAQSDTAYVVLQAATIVTVHSYLWWNGQYWEDIDTVQVEVIPLPEVHVAASAKRICEGESVLITVTGASRYSWDGGETFDFADNHTYLPDSTTMYVVYGLEAGAECYGLDSVLIIVDKMPDIHISGPAGVCFGEDAELEVEHDADFFAWSSEPRDPSLEGQEHQIKVIVSPQMTTVYTVNGQTGVCANEVSATVHVETPIAIGEVNPQKVSLGQMEATFIDRSVNTSSRLWRFEDGETYTEQTFTYRVPDDVDSVKVLLTAYNPYMCWDTTTVTVYVDHTTMWAPNAFTPDESTNNTFLVKMNDIQRYHIYIYDRRGQLVFESYDPEKPWDGTAQDGRKCAQEVYTYIVSGHKTNPPYEQLVYRGTVLLIR